MNYTIGYFLPRLSWVIVFLAGFVSSSGEAAAPTADRIQSSGDVKGVITLCSTPLPGAEVYVPGRSFAARTDVNGNFRLSYVQVGTYDLQVASGGKIVGTIAQVPIVSKQTTDTGATNFCNDSDGDGYFPPQDCDDGNPATNPGSSEVCGDGIDNNCNGATDENCPVCSDADGDGFFAQSGCQTGIDCDDSDASINPSATEICDGIDNDCDGTTDEPGSLGELLFSPDNDGDGYGDSSTPVLACSGPIGTIPDASDCNDADPSMHPNALEICGDLIDQDCDGEIDEGCGDPSAACSIDSECFSGNCVEGLCQ